MPFAGTPDGRTESIAKEIVDAALAVHRRFGPGLLESVYEQCLALELAKRGREVLRQQSVPIFYDGIELATPLRLDLLIDDTVIVEAKAVDKLISLHDAQCLTYLELTGRRLCLLINCNVELIRDAIKRIAR